MSENVTYGPSKFFANVSTQMRTMALVMVDLGAVSGDFPLVILETLKQLLYVCTRM